MSHLTLKPYELDTEPKLARIGRIFFVRRPSKYTNLLISEARSLAQTLFASISTLVLEKAKADSCFFAKKE